MSNLIVGYNNVLREKERNSQTLRDIERRKHIFPKKRFYSERNKEYNKVRKNIK